MKIIIGLGNPGKKYNKTRHNVGFIIVNKLQTTGYSQFALNKKFNTEIAKSQVNNEKILLAKPQTFMNNSGKAVAKVFNYYKISSKDIWIISDDIDLQLGQIRIRFKGSSGGHKGLQSIIDNLSTEKFPRIRVGIKTLKTDKIPAEKYVLQKFSEKEMEILDEIIEKTIEEIKKSMKYEIEEKTINV